MMDFPKSQSVKFADNVAILHIQYKSLTNDICLKVQMNSDKQKSVIFTYKRNTFHNPVTPESITIPKQYKESRIFLWKGDAIAD